MYLYFFNLETESLRCNFSSDRMNVRILYAKCPKGKHKSFSRISALPCRLYLAKIPFSFLEESWILRAEAL